MMHLVHSLTPVGHNLNKYSQVTHTCPYCDENETVFHLFQCPKNPMANILFLEQLELFLLKIRTAPFLQLIIMHQFRNGMKNSPQIGYAIPNWYLACAGLLPIDWTASQADYMEHLTRINAQRQGERWTQQLSYWLIRKSQSIWHKRNTKIHRSSNTDKTTTQLLKHVTELYSQKQQLLPTDQKMFHLPLDQRLNQPINTLKQWFSQTYATTQKCLQQSKILLQ